MHLRIEPVGNDRFVAATSAPLGGPEGWVTPAPMSATELTDALQAIGCPADVIMEAFARVEAASNVGRDVSIAAWLAALTALVLAFGFRVTADVCGQPKVVPPSSAGILSLIASLLGLTSLISIARDKRKLGLVAVLAVCELVMAVFLLGYYVLSRAEICAY